MVSEVKQFNGPIAENVYTSSVQISKASSNSTTTQVVSTRNTKDVKLTCSSSISKQEHASTNAKVTSNLAKINSTGTTLLPSYKNYQKL